MSARVAVNAKLEIQSTLGSALPITVATLANPVVVTSAAHGLVNGDFVVFVVSDGIVELDGILARVANKATDTWEVEGVNGLLFSALVASSTNAYKVTAFTTLSQATNVSLPDGAPARLDATVLYSVRKKYLFGLADDPGGTINAFYDPSQAAIAIIKAAARAQTRLGMRLTWREGQKTCWVANVQGGEGFTAAQNTIPTSDITLNRCGQIIEYAT